MDDQPDPPPATLEAATAVASSAPATLIGGLRLQALIAVALKGGAAGAALLLQWLVARIYGPEGTGLFALMATTATFVGVMAVLGQDYIGLRNVAGDLAEGDTAAARAHADASTRIALLGTVVGTMAMTGAAVVYGLGMQPAMMPILLLALPVVAGLSLGRVFAFVARAGGRVISSQLPDGPITSLVSAVGLGAAMLIWGTPPVWTLGALYGAAYMAALVFAAWLYRGVRRDWAQSGPPKALRPIALAGLPLVIASASPYFSDWLIIFTATALFSSEVAGQIRIVTLFLSVMYLVTIAFDSVLAPQMARAVRLGDKRRLKRIYRGYALGSLALNLPLIAAAVIRPDLLLGFFGPEFVPAAGALRVAVAIQALTVLLGPAGVVLVMAHRERLTLAVNAVGIIVLAIGCALVIPAYGVFGGGILGAAVLLSKRLTEIVLLRTLVWRRL